MKFCEPPRSSFDNLTFVNQHFRIIFIFWFQFFFQKCHIFGNFFLLKDFFTSCISLSLSFFSFLSVSFSPPLTCFLSLPSFLSLYLLFYLPSFFFLTVSTSPCHFLFPYLYSFLLSISLSIYLIVTSTIYPFFLCNYLYLSLCFPPPLQ